MKKNLVKVLTLALAAATIAGMSALSMPVYADETPTPTISVKTVTDVKANLTVTAYQIVAVTATGYEICDTTNANIADPENPKSNEVIAIAKYLRKNKETTTLKSVPLNRVGTTNTYSATNVDAGLYIVLVDGADAVVYNPALVAWNVKDPRNNSVNMNSGFSYGPEAYLKSTQSNFDKVIVDSSMNEEGDTAAHGDTVKFELKDMTIPYYTDQYTTVQYKITDEFEDGSFKGIKNLSVKVDDAEVVAGKDYTVTYKEVELDADGKPALSAGTTTADEAEYFEIAFSDNFIRSNPYGGVVVTYSTTFLNTATLNYAENVNTATLSYSNDPSDAASVKEIKDSTYHYTFGIDAELDIEAIKDNPDHGEQDKETFELNKVTEKGKTYSEATSVKGAKKKTQASPKWLDKALFTLHKEDTSAENNIGAEFLQAESDTNGHIRFVGLDTGTYYMKEKIAPPTYTLNTDIFKIVIAAELNDEGVMTQYSITTYISTDGGENYETEPVGVAVYKNTLPDSYEDYTDDNGNVTNTLSDYTNIKQVEIPNTQLAALPATGGEGTIAITIGGALGMAGFLTLYIANKRKKKAE